MKRSIDYYFSVASPWTYLGNARFSLLAERHNLDVTFRPVEFARLLDASGGLVYQKRAEQRRLYRQIELDRWRRYLDIALTLEPACYPVDRTPASLLMVASRHLTQQARFRLLQAILETIWRDDLDIADWQVLTGLMGRQVENADTIVAEAHRPESRALLAQHTDDAIKAGVFGAPTYVLGEELFWGQDRLDFLERALSG